MSYFKGIGKQTGSFGGRKNPLMGLLKSKKDTIFNRYVPGSGVGATSASVKRLKLQRCNRKCPEIKILPTLDELVIDKGLHVVDDGIQSLSTQELNILDGLDITTLLDLGNNNNNLVDIDILSNRIVKIIGEMKTSATISDYITFPSLSNYNLASAESITQILSSASFSNENINVYRSTYSDDIEIIDKEYYIEHSIIKTSGGYDYMSSIVLYK